jgi:Helix-turn-helix domain
VLLSDEQITMGREFNSRTARLMTTQEAADVLGRSLNTLKRWRYEGTGPAYVVIEGRVRYDQAVLEDYIRQNTRIPSVRAAREGKSRGTV